MKAVLFSLLVLTGAASAAQAQFSLDNRVNLSHQYQTYMSITEPNVVYMMPVAIQRVSDVKVLETGRRIRVQFDVGVPAAEYAKIDGLLAAQGRTGFKSTVYRALEAKLQSDSSTNIEARYGARIAIAGDVRNIQGPIRYYLSVRNLIRGGKSRTEALLKDLFGSKSLDHIGSLDVVFNTVVGGKPYAGKTTIPIMVGSHESAPSLESIVKSASRIVDVSSMFAETTPTPSLGFTLIHDEVSSCWEKPAAGVICLR